MSEVIDAFEQQGLVRPVGRTSGNVGRTAVLYELSPDGGHVLGIDLGARRLTVALADIAGRVLAEADEPTDNRGGAWALDQIARLSDRLARDNHTHPSRIRSIVMATPGVVNPKSGAIEIAPNITGLDHLNVVGLLGEKLGSPVAASVLDTTARWVALAVVTLQSLLDLELIVFGGSIGVRPELYERVQRALPALFSRPITIAPSRFGDRAGLIGAAWAAGHALRQNPGSAY